MWDKITDIRKRSFPCKLKKGLLTNKNRTEMVSAFGTHLHIERN